MALEQVFVNSETLERLREGPLAPQLDRFCRWLNDHGFARNTIRNHISHVSHFSRYLKQSGVTDSANLNSSQIRAFLADHLPHCKCRRAGAFQYNRIAFSVHRFMKYLQEYGFACPSDKHMTPYYSLLDDYTKWLKNYHHLASGTLRLRRHCLAQFLDRIDTSFTPNKLSTLSPDKIETFFLNYSNNHGQAARRSMQAVLRTFLRFCFIRGYIRRDLACAVPTLRTYKLDKLPRGIDDNQAQRLISSIDRKTKVGRRDYAIIQLLYTYGIRSGQVRALRLNDINWRQSQIRFAPLKHGKEVVQPLTDNVGESLLDYLKNTRPKISHPEVFLTSRAPYKPLGYSSTLSEIIARNMHRGDITSPSCGAHTFRHCFASRILKGGHSLKSIADMIGHRCIQTTFIYTKIDFQTLSQVALNWPEEIL
ncbi:MAG: site-specific recombinase [Candidatus Scalindua rubra]|uniref:Site-specific recombinase n=1 Tax=Candidatus Scalindua rubra TaxID=1872076 RepID=A0A1E3X3G6_9BACT|nr:MAG: site-specific recombinase [Candidatus Scalindua rubra]